MRLRGGSITLDDCNIWKSHDKLGPENCDADVLRRADNYLWLCAENADAWKRNGGKVVNLAETRGFPLSDTNLRASILPLKDLSLASSTASVLLRTFRMRRLLCLRVI